MAISISSVKFHRKSGYVVNGNITVPDDPRNPDYQSVQEWIDQGNTPAPAETSEETLTRVKKEKIQELKDEGFRRITAVLPGIHDWATLELVKQIWLSIAPSARSATAPFRSVINIYQAGQSAAQAINGLTTSEEVNSYDVAVDPSWP